MGNRSESSQVLMSKQKTNSMRLQDSSNTIQMREKNGGCLGTPNPHNVSQKYWQYTSNLDRSTPPICNAVPRWLLSFGDRETRQYTSNLYCSTPPICTSDTPRICTGHTRVGGSEKFLKEGKLMNRQNKKQRNSSRLCKEGNTHTQTMSSALPLRWGTIQ